MTYNIGKYSTTDTPFYMKPLLEARIEQQVSQIMLAEMTGYGVMTVHNWETGKTKPNVLNLIDVANALGLDLNLSITKKSQERED